MLSQEQYDEFAGDLDALADPLRAVLPATAFMTFNVPELGRPGIMVSARRIEAARYPFPISILIRWRDAAIQEYLEADAAERGPARKLRRAGAQHPAQHRARLRRRRLAR